VAETAAIGEKIKRFRETVYKDMGRQLDGYQLELKCFKSATFATAEKFEFAISCMRMQWPSFLLLEYGAIKNNWFYRIILEASRTKYLSLLGCASAGKSFAAAAWAYTFWKANFIDTSVVLSTTSMEALENRIWAEVKEMFKKDAYPLGKLLEYKHTIISPLDQEDKNQKDRDYRDAITGIAIPKGAEGGKAIGKMSGRKNGHFIWVVDELPHMDTAILDARINAAASGKFFSQWIGIGNKPNEGDPLYLDAEPAGAAYPDGWSSVDPDVDYRWKTRTGFCLYFDGERSPNMKVKPGENPPFPGLMSWELLQQVELVSGGKDSPGYWMQGRGFPKAGDIQDKVLTVKILENFGATADVIWAGMNKTVVAGLDLGLKEDGDPCVADFGTVGQEHQGGMVLMHEPDTVTLTQKISEGKPYEQQIAEKFLDECQKRSCRTVALDISGGGGLMAIAIKDEAAKRGWSLRIISVDFGGSPTEELYDVGGEKKAAKDLFDRKVSEIWYSYRLAVQNRKIRGVKIHCAAIKQMCKRKVIMDEKKRWKIETKRDMKLRIRRSPDQGDARALCALCARSEGLTNDATEKKRITMEWKPSGDPLKNEEKRGYQEKFTERRGYRSSYK